MLNNSGFINNKEIEDKNKYDTKKIVIKTGDEYEQLVPPLTPIMKPASDLQSAAGPETAEQGCSKISSFINYKKIFLTNFVESNCKCCICEIVEDFTMQYYNNASIIRDNDRAIHIPKVVD